MSKFRKKPVVIDAIQLNYKNWNAVCDFLGDGFSPAWNIPREEASDMCGEEGKGIAINVRTTHGETAVVRHGDWIIPDSKPNTFYPCKPDIFEKTYEPVEDIPAVQVSDTTGA
jgi:hypothetical protein